MPYVFTEQGIAMLSAVLKSDIAVEVSIKIMNNFVEMRRFLISNRELFSRLYRINQITENNRRKENPDLYQVTGLYVKICLVFA